MHLSHGRFKNLQIYRPAGTPASFVLFVSGDDGWTSTADRAARQLAQQGAMIAGIDWPEFRATLEADHDQCEFPDGDLENLSHFVQAYFHSPNYRSPILVGISSGATFAYAMLAQAPHNTFAAAVTLGFCPRLDLEKPLCKGSGLESVRSAGQRGVDPLPIKSLGNPWLNLQGDADRICPARTAQQFISEVKGAASVTLPTVGHDFAFAGRLDAAVHRGLRQTGGSESGYAHGAAACEFERSAHRRDPRAPRRAGRFGGCCAGRCGDTGRGTARCLRHHHVRRWRLGGTRSGRGRRAQREGDPGGGLGFIALLDGVNTRRPGGGYRPHHSLLARARRQAARAADRLFARGGCAAVRGQSAARAIRN